MRNQLIQVLKNNFLANIDKHKMNVEIMMRNPMGIHEHTAWMDAVEQELSHIAEYEDKLEALEKHFNHE